MGVKNKRTFSLGAIYTGFYIGVYAFTPLFMVLLNAREKPVSSRSWFIAVVWLIGFWILFGYASWRCSSSKLSYWIGLQWVVSSTNTGWWHAVLLIFPALLFVYVASVVIAFYNDLRGASKNTPSHFERLIYRFYRNRMRQ
jgi:hypothetical protein